MNASTQLLISGSQQCSKTIKALKATNIPQKLNGCKFGSLINCYEKKPYASFAIIKIKFRNFMRHRKFACAFLPCLKKCALELLDSLAFLINELCLISKVLDVLQGEQD